MTAAPAGPAPEQPNRPSLALVADCPTCQSRIVTVRERSGKPVRLDATPDGKAVVDPEGPWWLVKVAGQWRVQQLSDGEEEPTSGSGRRHREHQCELAAERAVETQFEWIPGDLGGWAHRPGPRTREGPCAGRCGRLVPDRYGSAATPMCESCRGALEAWRNLPGPHRPPLVFPPEPDGRASTPQTGAHRPAGRGRGLEGPACRERRELQQHPEDRPETATCVRCGRATSRRDSADGMPWCGGDFPQQAT